MILPLLITYYTVKLALSSTRSRNGLKSCAVQKYGPYQTKTREYVSGIEHASESSGRGCRDRHDGPGNKPADRNYASLQ
jgi:hypothetical protein